MRIFAIALFGLLTTSFAKADILEVNLWKAYPGKGAATFANGQKAKAIHEKNGATVTVANDLMGRMHYVLRHENYQAMNKFYTKNGGDPAWQEFWQAAVADPTAELIGFHTINIISAGEKVGQVYDTYVWQPQPGMQSTMFQSAVQAQAIHQKAGAYVDVGADKLNRLVYIMSFDSWEHYSKFMDTPIPEFEQFMQNAEPSAVLVENYTGAAQE